MQIIYLYAGLPRLVEENITSILHAANSKSETLSVFAFWMHDEKTTQTISFLKNKIKNSYFFEITPKQKTLELCESIKTKGKPKFNINGLHQFDALLQSFEQASKIINSTPDTIWTRSRTDLLIKRELLFSSPNKNTLYLPGAKYGIGYLDYFAWGDRDSIKNYVETYNVMTDLISNDIYLPPEVCLGITLHKHQVNTIIDRNLPATLIHTRDGKLKIRNSIQNERSSRSSYFVGTSFKGNKDKSKESLANEIRNRIIGSTIDAKNWISNKISQPPLSKTLINQK